MSRWVSVQKGSSWRDWATKCELASRRILCLRCIQYPPLLILGMLRLFPSNLPELFYGQPPNCVNCSGRCREVAEVSVKSTECADEVPRWETENWSRWEGEKTEGENLNLKVGRSCSLRKMKTEKEVKVANRKWKWLIYKLRKLVGWADGGIESCNLKVGKLLLLVLAKTQKFGFFNSFATHLSPDAKVAIPMEIWVKNVKIWIKTFPLICCRLFAQQQECNESLDKSHNVWKKHHIIIVNW